MKRVSLLLLAVLSAAMVATLAACGPSPRSRVKEFVKYLPQEAGDWERDDKATVELLGSTVTSKGHTTLQYEGPDDALAYIVVEAHPTEDAADVEYTSRVRELRLLGLAVDKNRAPPQATADIAQTDYVRYALFLEDEIVVEINALAGENPVSDEAFDELLTMVRNAYAKLAEDK